MYILNRKGEETPPSGKPAEIFKRGKKVELSRTTKCRSSRKDL